MSLHNDRSSAASQEKEYADHDISKESLAGNDANDQSREAGPPAIPDEEKAKPVQSNDPGPPPNGGLKAWMQVLGSWMLFFNTWGILK